METIHRLAEIVLGLTLLITDKKPEKKTLRGLFKKKEIDQETRQRYESSPDLSGLLKNMNALAPPPPPSPSPTTSKKVRYWMSFIHYNRRKMLKYLESPWKAYQKL
jgi:hypothetical protein